MADSLLLAAVVNRNSGAELKQSVLGLMEFLPPDRIVVVDCGSSDDSVESIKDMGVHVEALKENMGYAGGNNRALSIIRKWGGRLALIINPDARISPHNAALLAELLQDNKNIAAAFPVIYSERYKNHVDASFGVINYRHRLVRIEGEKALENRKSKKFFDIDFGIGCCFAVRVNDFFDAGGFDENIFAYHDEPDLCQRLRGIGKQVVLMPRVSAYHKGVEKNFKKRTAKEYFITRNSVIYMKKHGGFFKWTKFLFFLAGGILYYMPGALFKNKIKQARLLGYRDGFFNKGIDGKIRTLI